MDVGPFSVIQPNPTQWLMDPTQPNPRNKRAEQPNPLRKIEAVVFIAN